MPKMTVKYTGILGGRSPSRFRAGRDQFESSIGVDPDLATPVNGVATGVATPDIHVKFSGANVNSPVVAMVQDPKNTRVYAVLANGRLVYYDYALTTETLLGTFAGGNCGGAAYYNNYVYCFGTGNRLAYDTQTANFTVGQVVTGGTSGAFGTITADSDSGTTGTLTLKSILGNFTLGESLTDPLGGSAKVHAIVSGQTDVSRYGPLDGTPAFENAWWTGQGLTPLTATTYPTIYSLYLPNHWAFVHKPDNCLYFCDYSAGFGLIHRIHTKKTTSEGDTNETANPSLYAALTLPVNSYPTSIASYGTSISVTTVTTGDLSMNEGHASLNLWNSGQISSIGPDQVVSLPDPAATAQVVRDGFLHVFTGSGVDCRLSTYSGGDTIQEVAYLPDAPPPLAGGVDVVGSRMLFGSRCSYPVESACVYAVGSRTSGKDDVQNIVTVGSQLASQDAMTGAIRVVTYGSGYHQVAASSYDGTSGNAIYKRGAGTLQSYLCLPPIVVGAGFRITKLRIPLASAVASGTVVTPTLTYDDVDSTTLADISNANYPSKRKVIYRAQEMTYKGENQFRLQFRWTGTAATPLLFPIEMELDVDDDEKN